MIKLLIDLPDEGLGKGAVGTIVMILAENSAYECEFCDNEGRPISRSLTVTLARKEFGVTSSASS